MAPRLREVIGSIPEIRAVMSHVGRPDDGTDVTSYYNLEFNAPLIPMEEWRKKPVKIFGKEVWQRSITREEIQDELMKKFEIFPSVNFNFSQLIRDNVEEALSGVKGANSIKLFGTDLNVLETTGQRVINILNTVPGITNAGLFHIVGQPNLEIQIDRQECARYGINVSAVEAVVQVAVGGRAFTQMIEGEKRFDIVLRLPKHQRDDPEVIERIPVDTPGQDGKPGARIPLKQVAKIDPHKPGTAYIYRENNRRYIPIKFSVQGRDLASTIAEAKKKVNDPQHGANLPNGYDIDWSGEFQQMEEANGRLLWIVPISIGLIMVLLYTAFSSIKDSLLVMVNVIEASMGGILALWITGTPFSISAAVGFVSVFGVAVQDGVLLISYFNQLREGRIAIKAARPTLLNGIEDIIGRSDLADRAILLTLGPIGEEQRRSETELWREFELARPAILGALLDAAAHGLRAVGSVHLGRLPRMADFALWATACETGLWPAGTFTRAYAANRKAAIEGIIDADPIAACVREFMSERPSWTGSAADLLRVSVERSSDRIPRDGTGWPKNPRALAGHLRRAQTFLRALGIEIAFSRQGRAGSRVIRMRSFPENTVSTVSSVSDSASGADSEQQP